MYNIIGLRYLLPTAQLHSLRDYQLNQPLDRIIYYIIIQHAHAILCLPKNSRNLFSGTTSLTVCGR